MITRPISLAPFLVKKLTCQRSGPFRYASANEPRVVPLQRLHLRQRPRDLEDPVRRQPAARRVQVRFEHRNGGFRGTRRVPVLAEWVPVATALVRATLGASERAVSARAPGTDEREYEQAAESWRDAAHEPRVNVCLSPRSRLRRPRARVRWPAPRLRSAAVPSTSATRAVPRRCSAAARSGRGSATRRRGSSTGPAPRPAGPDRRARAGRASRHGAASRGCRRRRAQRHPSRTNS